MFAQISDNTAFSEKIVTQITDAIVRGELHPGDRLPTERDLADQFGVSRTAVRDAVKILAGRGILQVRRGIGIFVSETQTVYEDVNLALMDKYNTLKELFEIRRILESQAAQWAAERATPQQVHRLQEIIDDALIHSQEPEILGQRDAQFHVGLAESSRNLILTRLMLTLLDTLSQSRTESLSIHGLPQQSLADHQAILDAIKERDGKLAKKNMQNHLKRVEKTIVTHMNR